MNLSSSFYVWRQLLHREWLLFLKTLKDSSVNAVLTGGFMTLLFGYLLPILGMDPALSIPMFFGTLIMFILGVGYSTCMQIAFDIRTTKVLQYHLSLPVHPLVSLSALVCGVMLRMLGIAVPVVALGLSGMGGYAHLSVSFLPLLAMLFLVPAFFALIFYFIGIYFSIRTVLGNIWPRMLHPLFSFGATYYAHDRAVAFIPSLEPLLLLNPVTYCTEGLRASLLGGSNFLPAWHCMTVLLVVCSILFLMVYRVARAQLQIIVPGSRA